MSLEEEDDPFEADGVNRIEVEGTISELNVVDSTFIVEGFLITLNDDTIIDDDIVSRARGEDVENDAGFRLGDLPETVDQLFAIGDDVEVLIDADATALRVEDD